MNKMFLYFVAATWFTSVTNASATDAFIDEVPPAATYVPPPAVRDESALSPRLQQCWDNAKKQHPGTPSVQTPPILIFAMLNAKGHVTFTTADDQSKKNAQNNADVLNVLNRAVLAVKTCSPYPELIKPGQQEVRHIFSFNPNEGAERSY